MAKKDEAKDETPKQHKAAEAKDRKKIDDATREEGEGAASPKPTTVGPDKEEAEVDRDAETDRPVKTYSGEPIDVEVGDIFESKGNPGGGVVVTPEILRDLVFRKKANPPAEPIPGTDAENKAIAEGKDDSDK